MSTRSPIQVPDELKTKIDSMKERFYAKTHYEVIEKLLSNFEKNLILNEKRIVDQQAEKDRQKAEVIQLTTSIKKKYIDFQNEMGFKKETDVFEFLYEHYKNSKSIDKQTLKVYQELRE
jgi:hypothetical protein